MNRSRLTVESVASGKRLDQYLALHFSQISRSYFQQLIRNGHVLVNGQSAKPRYLLRENDEIIIECPPPSPYEAKPEPISLDIRYEDKWVLVINKPRGMVVHPSAGHREGTMVNALLYHCQDGLSGINGTVRPGIVHRLDKDTSGLLVVAKNDEAHQYLTRQLAKRQMTRIYKALVCGVIQEEHIKIDVPIGRDPFHRKKMAVVEGGKRAVTHLTVKERMKGYTLVEAKLETGRTHQIRVHMAYIRHPIVGDSRYGGTKMEEMISGQCLHAGELVFRHPSTGTPVSVKAPWPEDFQNALHKARQ